LRVARAFEIVDLVLQFLVPIASFRPEPAAV
jgi:hypothetical protein